jgi:hypothetical protein
MVRAQIELANPARPELKPVLVARQIEAREVAAASEELRMAPYLGPIQIKSQNRTWFAGALPTGETVLFGAVPVHGMDLVIPLSRETISMNPRGANMPSTPVG